MKRIKYIDTICTNSMHIIFNATLLAICKNISPDIIFYAQKENQTKILEALKENTIPINSIKKKCIFLFEGNTKYKHIFNFFISFFYNICFIFFSSKNDILIFNYNNLLSIRIINFINKICKRKIIIFCHGEMEFLKKNMREYALFNKLLLLLGKNFFLNKRISIERNIIFFVLGDSILFNLKRILPNNIYGSFHSIDHPYFFRKRSFVGEKKSDLIKIGTIGIFSKQKGADDFCSICEAVNNPNVKFSITGKIFYDIKKLMSLQVDLPKDNGSSMLARKELEERADKLDFILFLYPNSSYELIASGAVLDAINIKKPILALKNNYFNYLFDKFGAFGYLAESVQELILIIETIEKKNRIFDFDTIQNNLNVKNITKSFKDKLSKIGFL